MKRPGVVDWERIEALKAEMPERTWFEENGAPRVLLESDRTLDEKLHWMYRTAEQMRRRRFNP